MSQGREGAIVSISSMTRYGLENMIILYARAYNTVQKSSQSSFAYVLQNLERRVHVLAPLIFEKLAFSDWLDGKRIENDIRNQQRLKVRGNSLFAISYTFAIIFAIFT